MWAIRNGKSKSLSRCLVLTFVINILKFSKTFRIVEGTGWTFLSSLSLSSPPLPTHIRTVDYGDGGWELADKNYCVVVVVGVVVVVATDGRRARGVTSTVALRAARIGATAGRYCASSRGLAYRGSRW